MDILFANAGIGGLSPINLITEKHFDDIFNVNVKGVLFTVQKALPILTDGGSIILNGSICAVKGYPDQSVYNASKATIRSFARCWTVDLKERRIRVNTLSLGPIDTPMLRTAPDHDAFTAKLIAATAMNRLGTPEEIAKVAVFLASDDSSYITGIDLSADGGLAQI